MNNSGAALAREGRKRFLLSARRNCPKAGASRITPLRRRLRGFLVALALPIMHCGAAAELKFDPTTCKHASESFYVALGRYVFATPSPAKASLGVDPVAESKLLKVPDPNDPVGCFDNPLQSNSHALLNTMAFGVSVAGYSNLLVPKVLTLYNLRRGSSPGEGKPAEWPGEVMEQHIVERVCRTATVRENLANGLVACRIKPVNPPNARPEDWTASYTTSPEVYTTPLGKPFIINCGPGLRDGIDQCDVAYAINPGVGVSYQFQPFRGRHPIPIDQAIAYDKSLRDSIERALVKGYPWPE
jgi:hypothetical protein